MLLNDTHFFDKNMNQLINATRSYQLTSLYLLLSVGLTMAQQTTKLTGRVTDAITGKPIAFASVYINSSTRGTTADSVGHFTLTNSPVGSIELVATAIGYKASRQPLRLVDQHTPSVLLALQPEARELNSVTVMAKRTKAYDRQLRQFQRELLGDVLFADKCSITNLEKVKLTQEGGYLRASINEPLAIENKALGYRLYYDLGHFQTFRQATFYAGTSRFEEMQPETAQQQQIWQRNRQRAYRGSLRHLITSLLAGTQEKEGFLVYQATFDVPADPGIPLLLFVGQEPGTPVQADSLFRPGELPQERELRSTRPLEIIYSRKVSLNSPYRRLPFAYTLLLLPKGYATVTTNGWVSQPMGMELRGNMNDNRLASLLPADWNPGLDYMTSRADTLNTGNTGKLMKPDARLDSLTRSLLDQQQNTSAAIFLHIAKPFYVASDRLWFSGYMLDPSTGELAGTRAEAQEEAIHVELVSPTNRRVEHQWIPVRQGRLSGSFMLADTLTTGTYRLRAYITDGIQRDQPTFERTLTVVNPGRPLSPGASTTAQTDDSLDVQGLPEGGRWVSGIPGRVGIKVVDRTGRGRSVSGQVVTGGGEAIPFSTNTLGMGSLNLTPGPNQPYYYQLKAEAVHHPFRLPPVDSVGFTLAADWVTDSTWLAVQIRASPQWKQRVVFLTIQSQGQLVQQTKLQLQEGKAQLGISTARCLPGVTRITLSDEAGRAYAERLVFVPERRSPVKAVFTPNQPSYAPHEQISLDLRLTNEQGEPVQLSGSAAVLDDSQVPADSAGPTLRTHLLLTGDLQGQVEQPEIYFKDNTPQTRQAIDDLLLTQGWRRLVTPRVMDGQALTRTLGLTGRILTRRGRPVPDANLLFHFIAGDSVLFARSTRANAEGRFRLADLNWVDTVWIRVQVMNDQFKPLVAHAVFDQPGLRFEAPIYREQSYLATVADYGTKAQLRLTASTGRVLQEVVVRAARPDNDTEARRVSVHGTPDATIKPGDKAGTYPNVYEMIASRVPGVQVSRKSSISGEYSVVIRGSSSFNSGGNEPLYLLDGTTISGSALLMLDPHTIDRIEVIKNGGGAMYGARGAPGIIAFYSKKWDGKSSLSLLKTGSEVVALGYAAQRQFYQPRYEATVSDDRKEVDRRDVLLWQPLLLIDTQGQVRLSFPKSDVVQRIRITVQGVSPDGRPVYINQLLNIR